MKKLYAHSACTSCARSTVPRLPMSSKWASKKRCAARRSQHFEEIVVGVELALRIERLGGPLERDPVHVNTAVLARPYAARQSALIDQPGDELDRAQFAHERGIECDFVQTGHDLLVRGRRRVALQRIDLHRQHASVVVVLNRGKIDGLPR